jgi:hypothetical protein
MLGWIDWNQSSTPGKRDQRVKMVTEWGRKNYKEDIKKLQMGWEETLFIEDRGSFFRSAFLLQDCSAS